MNPNFQQNIPLILVIDDDRSLRTLLVVALSEEGYEVAEANNGEQGLSEFKRLLPDMVLLDAVMPVMDGFICCEKLRNLPAAEYTPVLMLTVLDDQNSVDRAFECGATDYVTKPIHWAVLRQRVNRLLKASLAQKQVNLITQAFEKQLRKERLVQDTLRRLNQSLTGKQILNPLMAGIREILAADSSLLYQKTGDLFLTNSGFRETFLGQYSLADFSWAKEYAGEWEEGKVLAIADINQTEISESARQVYQKLNIKAALVAPIFIKGNFWGLLEVHQSYFREWEAAEIGLLGNLADLVAVAIRLRQ